MFHAGYWPPSSQKGRSFPQFSLQGRRGNAWYGTPCVADLCPLFRRIDVHHSEREVHNPPALERLIIRKSRSSRSLSRNGYLRASQLIGVALLISARPLVVRICIFIVLLLHVLLRLAVVDQIGSNACHLLILERQSRTLGLSHTRP